MTMPPISRGSVLARNLGKVAVAGAAALVICSVVAGVAFSPVVMGMLNSGGVDWSRLSDIGQAYGAGSALLSAVALGIVVVLQRGQVRHERTWRLREMHVDVMKIALDEPMYAQCWGPRMAPPHIDERLFYYVNLIVMLWFYSWESGELRDAQVQSYSAGLFESAVARDFWAWHGSWRLAAASGRRLRFLRIVDREYHRAVLAGPPSRRLEARRTRPARAGMRAPGYRRLAGGRSKTPSLTASMKARQGRLAK
jgi:hypothetical protein